MALNQAQTDGAGQTQTNSDDPLGVPAYDGENPDSPSSGSIWYRTDLNTLVGKLDNEIVDLLTGTTIGADYSPDDGSGQPDGDDSDDGGWTFSFDGGDDDAGDGGQSDSGSMSDWLAGGDASDSDTDGGDASGNESADESDDGGDFPW